MGDVRRAIDAALAQYVAQFERRHHGDAGTLSPYAVEALRRGAQPDVERTVEVTRAMSAMTLAGGNKES